MTIEPYNPPHPGELIKRTYIDPFKDISGNQIAKHLGVAVSTFNRLINGVSDISPEMAIRLSLDDLQKAGFCYKVTMIYGKPVEGLILISWNPLGL